MKSMLIFALLALTFAISFASDVCDPDSNGEPICTAENEGESFRNFWDPTRFWYCPGANSPAESIACSTATLYDAVSEECISWIDWKWESPCGETQS